MNLWLRRASWGMVVILSLACFPALTSGGQRKGSDEEEDRRPNVRMPGRRGRPTPRPTRPGPQAPSAAAPAPSAPAASLSQPIEVFQGAGGTKMIRMWFFGVDIDDLLRLLSREAGVTIIKSEQVSGPITVIAPDPVPLDVAFQILNSVLSVRGFTMVRTTTGIYKVIPIAEAMQSGLPLEFGNRPEDVPSSDSFITQVIPFTNLDAQDVAAQVQGLLSPNASLIPTSTNCLIITDTASNIQRILTLIADSESQLSGGLQVIPIRYYDAQEMADLVYSLILGRGGGVTGAGVAGRRIQPYERRLTQRAPGVTQPPRAPVGVGGGMGMGGVGPEFCYPDVRTNSLIVLATPTHLQQIQDLVEQLDRPISLRDSFFIYPVQNLVASDLAQKVGPLIGAQVSAQAAPGGAASAAAVRGRATTGLGTPGPGYGVTSPTAGAGRFRSSSASPGDRERPLQAAAFEVEPLAGTAPDRSGSDAVTIAQAPEGVAPLPAQPPGTPPVEFIAGLPEEALSVPGAGARQATITADDNTNLLLISASLEQLELAKQLLEKLDVAAPQVHIQAIIAEVTLTRDTSLGFQWESLGRTFGAFRGGTFTGDISSNFGLGALGTDASGRVTGPSGFFGQISGPEFRGVLAALTTDTHARILSTPSIITSNNQAAQIDVSSSRPFPRGTVSTPIVGGTTGFATSTSIEYQSVGIVLTVTPRITQGNMVQMDVTVSADEPGAPVTIAGQDYPSVARRMTRANLHVQDGYTIILGGLMRDIMTRSGSRVPLLGDLPLIGALFRSTKSKREKSELLVFLTPHVVRTPAQAAAVTEDEKAKLGEVPRSLQSPAGASAAGERERR